VCALSFFWPEVGYFLDRVVRKYIRQNKTTLDVKNIYMQLEVLMETSDIQIYSQLELIMETPDIQIYRQLELIMETPDIQT
jgi:hypothetical protein